MLSPEYATQQCAVQYPLKEFPLDDAHFGFQTTLEFVSNRSKCIPFSETVKVVQTMLPVFKVRETHGEI